MLSKFPEYLRMYAFAPKIVIVLQHHAWLMDGDIALAKRKGAGSNVACPKGKARKIPKPKISKLEADISKFTAQEQDELFARIVEQRKLQSSISLNEIENLESEEVTPFAKDIMATAALRIELGDVLQKQVELKAKEKKLKILIRKQERSIILASRESGWCHLEYYLVFL